MADRIIRNQIGKVTKDSEVLGETNGENLTEKETTETTESAFDTPEKKLAVLNDAIYKILVGGQSYKIGSRQLTRADLNRVIAERDKIEQQIVNAEDSPLFPGTYAADFGYDNRR